MATKRRSSDVTRRHAVAVRNSFHQLQVASSPVSSPSAVSGSPLAPLLISAAIHSVTTISHASCAPASSLHAPATAIRQVEPDERSATVRKHTLSWPVRLKPLANALQKTPAESITHAPTQIATTTTTAPKKEVDNVSPAVMDSNRGAVGFVPSKNAPMAAGVLPQQNTTINGWKAVLGLQPYKEETPQQTIVFGSTEAAFRLLNHPLDRSTLPALAQTRHDWVILREEHQARRLRFTSVVLKGTTTTTTTAATPATTSPAAPRPTRGWALQRIQSLSVRNAHQDALPPVASRSITAAGAGAAPSATAKATSATSPTVRVAERKTPTLRPIQNFFSTIVSPSSRKTPANKVAAPPTVKAAIAATTTTTNKTPLLRLRRDITAETETTNSSSTSFSARGNTTTTTTTTDGCTTITVLSARRDR